MTPAAAESGASRPCVPRGRARGGLQPGVTPGPGWRSQGPSPGERVDSARSPHSTLSQLSGPAGPAECRKSCRRPGRRTSPKAGNAAEEWPGAAPSSAAGRPGWGRRGADHGGASAQAFLRPHKFCHHCKSSRESSRKEVEVSETPSGCAVSWMG